MVMADNHAWQHSFALPCNPAKNQQHGHTLIILLHSRVAAVVGHIERLRQVDNLTHWVSGYGYIIGLISVAH